MAADPFAEHKITDPVAVAEYRTRALAAVDRYGGKLSLGANSIEALAGSWQPDRFVVLEFADMATLKAMYELRDHHSLSGICDGAATNVLLAIQA